jgi:hypothetical protein
VLPPDVAATTMAPLSAAGPHDGHFPDTLVSLDLLRTASGDRFQEARLDGHLREF